MIQPDKIVRSNRKTLAVGVDHFGRIIVRAPRKMDEKRIYAFLEEKEPWLRKKQAEQAAFSTILPPDDLDGYTFLLLGENCTIRLTDSKFVVFDEENKILFLPTKNAKERLIKWLKDNAKRIFTALTIRKATEMGVTFQKVGISSARTLWGTCAVDNTIRYTFRLLYAPKPVIEYVIVHELSHVRYKNHSQAFWKEVEKYVPDWKKHRNWLKTHGGLMEIF